MSDGDREKWDRRYGEGDYRPRTWASPFVEVWADRLPRGRALDLACGTGRNALFLAGIGFAVDAIDISSVAIARGRSEAERRSIDVTWINQDLDTLELASEAYEVITVIRYMNRLLWPRLSEALAANGFLLIEHHMRASADVGGPSEPDFRLEPQELLEAFGHHRVLHYEEVIEADRDGGTYALQRLVACKGDPGW